MPSREISPRLVCGLCDSTATAVVTPGPERALLRHWELGPVIFISWSVLLVSYGWAALVDDGARFVHQKSAADAPTAPQTPDPDPPRPRPPHPSFTSL